MSFAPMRDPKGTPESGGVDPLLKGWFFGCFGLFALAVLVVFAFSLSASKDDPAKEYELQSELSIRACERAVEARLKAPDTAEFSDVTSRQSDSGWKIRGSVDAQNSFGAQIRNTFSCDATVTDGAAKVHGLEIG